MNSSNRSAISGWSALRFVRGTNAGRIIRHENRPRQLVLDLLFKHLVLDQRLGCLPAVSNPILSAYSATAGRIARINSRVLLKQLVVRLAIEGRSEVDLDVAPLQLRYLDRLPQIASTMIFSVKSIMLR